MKNADGGDRDSPERRAFKKKTKMQKESPYEYFEGKLGVKIAYLITSDKNKSCHPDSLHLISYRTFKKRMDSFTCTEKQLRSGFLNNPALVEFNSLSRDWQQQLIHRFGHAPENIRQSYFSTQYQWDEKAYRFFSQEYTEGPERRRLELPKVEEYTYNASVLNTVGKVHSNRKSFRKLLNSSCADIWTILSTEVNNFTDVPHSLPISPDGLRKKFSKFEKDGYTSLIDGRRNNDNARKVDADLIKFFNDLFAGQNFKPTMTQIARQYESFLSGYLEVINEVTGEAYDPKGFKKISRSTIMAYLSEWENTIATHQLRGGDRQRNMQNFKPHHEMELPTFAGSLLSIDDRQPPFEYEKGKRMWFYIGMDVASGCFTAFVYGTTKEGIIMEFYRQLVRNYTEWNLPVPYELECESSLNSSFKGTFLREGAMFQKVRIEANNARGKYIEREFGSLRYEIEKEELGWIARPFAESEANQAGNHNVPIIPLDQLIESRLKNIEDWNNMPSTQNPLLSKFEYFLEMQHPDIPQTNWRAILPYIGHEQKSSCNVGYIMLQGRKRMIADDGKILFGESLIAKMKKIEGQNLQVYWLDANDGTVLKAVAFMDGEYMCELLPIPRYNRSQLEQTPEDIAAREIQSKYVASVEAFAKIQKKSIDKVLVIKKDDNQLQPTRKFTIQGLNRFQKRETEVEQLPEHEDEFVLINQDRPASSGWRNNF